MGRFQLMSERLYLPPMEAHKCKTIFLFSVHFKFCFLEIGILKTNDGYIASSFKIEQKMGACHHLSNPPFQGKRCQSGSLLLLEILHF